MLTVAAGAVEPGNSHTVTHLEPLHRGINSHDLAHSLMAWDKRQLRLRWPVPVDCVQVCVAHPTRVDLESRERRGRGRGREREITITRSLCESACHHIDKTATTHWSHLYEDLSLAGLRCGDCHNLERFPEFVHHCSPHSCRYDLAYCGHGGLFLGGWGGTLLDRLSKQR